MSTIKETQDGGIDKFVNEVIRMSSETCDMHIDLNDGIKNASELVAILKRSYNRNIDCEDVLNASIKFK